MQTFPLKFWQCLTLKLVVLTGAILLSMPLTYADVIYRETFGGPSTPAANVNTNFEFDGWSGYWSPTAQNEAAGNTAGAWNNFGAGSSLGIPTNLTNINAGIEARTNGFPFSSGFNSVSNNLLVYTTEYTVDTSIFSISTISFYSGNTSNTFPNGMPGWRIAVQIGGAWYASDQLLIQTSIVANAAGFNTSGQKLVFNWTTAAGAWDALTFVPGVTLALGPNTGLALPGGNLDAFGLYSDPAINTNGVGGIATRRWDTYEINASAIPEPSSVALVLIGAVTLLGLRRSRKA